jgi:hypothetical protein
MPLEQIEKAIPIETHSSFELVGNILFQLGIYKEYKAITKSFKDALEFFLPSVEINNAKKQLIVNGIIITEEI